MNTLIHRILEQKRELISGVEPSIYIGFKLNTTTEDPEFVFHGFTNQIVDVSIMLYANWGCSNITFPGDPPSVTSDAQVDASILGGTGSGSASGTCTTTLNCGGTDTDYMNCVGLTKDSSIVITAQNVGNCYYDPFWDVFGVIKVEIVSARVTSGSGIANPSTGATTWERTNQTCSDIRSIY